MRNDSHDQTEELLPWYATGQLDAADRAFVEVHLASCARCQRALATERVLIDEFQSLSPETAGGWAQLRGRITAKQPTRRQFGPALAELWHTLTRPVIAA